MAQPYSSELTARFGYYLDLGGPEGDRPDDNPWIRQVLLRRTHRRYSDRPVPESVLRLILAAAFSASSKSDYQQATVIRVEDRRQRDKLAALIPDMPWIGNAPVFLVFLGDARRLERISKHPVENGTLEGFFNATVDATLALQTCTLAAETLGLGSCPISVLRNHIEAVGEILSLPDRRDARHSLKDRQKSPEIFGAAEFYGWSEDKARQTMSPEGAGFAAWLRARGFDLSK